MENEKILIESQNYYTHGDNFIEVTATTNNVTFDNKQKRFTTTALVTNYTPYTYTGNFSTQFEYLHEYELKDITQDTLNESINLSNKFKLSLFIKTF